MLTDQQASELIVRSLHGELSEEEANQIRDHLQQSPGSRSFAELSRLIHDAAREAGRQSRTGDASTGQPNLSDDARQRLKKAIRTALAEGGRTVSPAPGPAADAYRRDHELPAAALVAEAKTAYHVSDTSTGESVREAVSQFTLLRPLGQGGLGQVWLARDERLRRNVAIKELLQSGRSTPTLWQRFQREAEITGHLEHPNIVPLYQFGIDRHTGEPFYAMRFVGKRTLADAILEHHDRREADRDYDETLGLHRLLTAFLDVCQAIAYAHSRGVIHRDLKPDNVALDSFGQVIVLDWGLAKLTEDGELLSQLEHRDDSAGAAADQTLEGDVIGTPLFMAPEQASGELNQIDERTDIYGLGAILFAILTGVAPHQSSDRRTPASVHEVLRSIATNRSPQPADFSDDVPRELEAICIKAMHFKRHLRHESVLQLSGAVERWMAGQSQKQIKYDSLRMEGRELRADLQSSVRDLERNVRFMSRLPPIQEIIQLADDQDPSAWRRRLATIYHGLLSANSDYQSVVYSRIVEDRFEEIVRVERHSTDPSQIRAVPRSRLRSAGLDSFLESVIRQQPDEVFTSLVCDPACDSAVGCFDDDRLHLVAAVPVYDEVEETLYGVVMIDCDIDRLLRRQMNRRTEAVDLVVACDIHHIMMRRQSGQISEEALGQPVARVAPHFLPAVEALQSELEYLDEVDAEIYGARLWLIPQKHGLMYLLRRGRDSGPATR